MQCKLANRGWVRAVSYFAVPNSTHPTVRMGCPSAAVSEPLLHSIVHRRPCTFGRRSGTLRHPCEGVMLVARWAPLPFCSRPSLLRKPSVKLGRRTTAAHQAAPPMRSGRLPVFAVSEPSVRFTQVALACSARLRGIEAEDRTLFNRRCLVPHPLSLLPLPLRGVSARAAHRLKFKRPRRVRRRLVHSPRSPRH